MFVEVVYKELAAKRAPKPKAESRKPKTEK
jgi:hypothetical protein